MTKEGPGDRRLGQAATPYTLPKAVTDNPRRTLGDAFPPPPLKEVNRDEKENSK